AHVKRGKGCKVLNLPGPVLMEWAMRLPFSREAFLDVFAVYNTSLWPIAAVLWVATAVAFAWHMTGRGRKDWTVGLLAFQWAWAAIAYHAMLFSRINPAAWAFAALFLVEASLFVWYGVVRGRLQFSRENTVQERIAYIL